MAIGLGDLKKKSKTSVAKGTTKVRAEMAQPWSAEGLQRPAEKAVTYDDESTTYRAPLLLFGVSRESRLKLTHQVISKIEERVGSAISGAMKIKSKLRWRL